MNRTERTEMSVARAAARVLQCARERKKGSLPVFRVTLPRTTVGARAAVKAGKHASQRRPAGAEPAPRSAASRFSVVAPDTVSQEGYHESTALRRVSSESRSSPPLRRRPSRPRPRAAAAQPGADRPSRSRASRRPSRPQPDGRRRRRPVDRQAGRRRRPSRRQPAQKPTVPAANGRASTPRQSPTAGAAAPSCQPSVDDDKPVIVHSDLITLTVTVTDTYGRFVTGLGKNAFTDLRRQDAAGDHSSSRDEDAPVSLGVVFDVSGSMSGDKIMKAREALSKFIDTSHSARRVFPHRLQHRAQLLLNHTRDSDALMHKLTFVQTQGADGALRRHLPRRRARDARRAQEARHPAHLATGRTTARATPSRS